MRAVERSGVKNPDGTLVFEKRMREGDPLGGSDLLLSPANAARYLDVKRKFVYELMARREIDFVPVGRRLKRIRLSAIESWLSKSQRRR